MTGGGDVRTVGLRAPDGTLAGQPSGAVALPQDHPFLDVTPQVRQDLPQVLGPGAEGYVAAYEATRDGKPAGGRWVWLALFWALPYLLWRRQTRAAAALLLIVLVFDLIGARFVWGLFLTVAGVVLALHGRRVVVRTALDRIAEANRFATSDEDRARLLSGAVAPSPAGAVLGIVLAGCLAYVWFFQSADFHFSVGPLSIGYVADDATEDEPDEAADDNRDDGAGDAAEDRRFGDADDAISPSPPPQSPASAPGAPGPAGISSP